MPLPQPNCRILLIPDSKDDSYRLPALTDLTVYIGDPAANTLDEVKHHDPHMVVLSPNLPWSSVIAIGQALHEAPDTAQIPVLHLSDRVDSARLCEALQHGIDDLLAADTDAPTLEALIAARCTKALHGRSVAEKLTTTTLELEHQLQALDEHAIVSIANPAGNITYVNDKFCAISGYSRNELLGQNHRILKSGQQDDALFVDMWQTIAAGQVWHGVICNRNKAGGHYWVSSTIVPFTDSTGRPYQYVSLRTDVSAIKNTEQKLALREQELHTILDTVPALIWFKDSAGRILRCNARAAAVVGLSPEQVEGRFIDEFFPTQAERSREVDRKIMQSGQPLLGLREEYEVAGEQRYFQIDRVPYLDEQGRPIGVVLMAQDITKQEETERALAENEERLRRSQAFANIGTWDWNIQSGELFWSERIAPLFGHDVESLETTYDNFLAAVHPDDREMVTEAVNACVAGSADYNIEHRVVWPDGQVRWLSEKGDVVRDKDGRPLRMLGVVQDIHSRKMAEENLRESRAALKESEAKFRGLYELSPVGIALNEMDGNFIEANQAFLDIIGYSNEECRALSYWDLTPKEYAAQEEQQLESLNSSGRYGPYEKEYIHKDGHRVPVLLNGTIVTDRRGTPRIWSLVQDISARKRYEETLNRFKTTLDQTHDCVFMFDPEELRFFYVNHGAVEQVGYSTEELMSMHPYDIKPDYDEAAFRELIRPLQEKGEGVITLETRHRHRDGMLIPVEIALQYVAPQGEPARFVAIVRNVSERRALEARLIKARDDAEQANRAKSQFLSSMSHELRTPMNAILGFAQLLELDDDNPLNEDQRENIADILNAGNHLLDLINEVLDLAKVEAGKIDLTIEELDLKELVATCLSFVQPLAAQYRVQLHIEPDAFAQCLVHADYKRSKQVLLNLLSNAIKYNRHDGSGNVYLSTSTTDDGFLRLAVTDTGKGISPENLAQLFESFNRLDAQYSDVEGTGIGLVITRELVELMGGQIGVESSVGQGSTFWFTLPLQAGTLQPAPGGGGDEVTGNRLHSHHHTILYIEDNPVNLKLVTQVIAKHTSLDLISANEPVTGLKMARSQKPDLILLDINLPGMDGFEVLKCLRSGDQPYTGKVLALSANAMDSQVERGLAAGFDEYLTKPVDVGKLLAALERYLGELP